ncbi:hypothetical protein ACPV30_04105 [Photobacterium damselae]|uniref:hypothetical protein n=1 Tax=Photobacterium damselae TaxID=38293 RepID=UPI001EDFB377|nr:hypothetical protein [Photobacterium damselae]EJN6960581.1 hypothetical protein [Photobacterium damselae]EJN6962143.1 hypothetical protein [Photobacterium damselae]MCG3845646.1 hypothetical protein [Photobacterium damselae]
MKHAEWIREAYLNTSQALAECYNTSHIDGWNENYITTSLLKSLEKIGLEIDWTDKYQKVKWEGFKLRGNPEFEFGDIAVVVRIWVTSERYVDGIAFYEAKRQFFRDNNSPIGFSSLKIDQLSRIHEYTHASNVLLYDVDISEETALASSVAMPFVKELAEANLASSSGRILHHYGEPWVTSLANNLLGLHLDFREDVVESIKNSTDTYRKPKFILNASVALSKVLEPKLDNSFVNKNDYEHWIKKDEPKPKPKNTIKYDGPKF